MYSPQHLFSSALVRTRSVSLFFLATAHGSCYFSLIWAVAVPEEGGLCSDRREMVWLGGKVWLF